MQKSLDWRVKYRQALIILSMVLILSVFLVSCADKKTGKAYWWQRQSPSPSPPSSPSPIPSPSPTPECEDISDCPPCDMCYEGKCFSWKQECPNGDCVRYLKDCPCDPPDCNDGNDCTRDECNEGKCEHTKLSYTSCYTDYSFPSDCCNGECCELGESCINGVCTGCRDYCTTACLSGEEKEDLIEGFPVGRVAGCVISVTAGKEPCALPKEFSWRVCVGLNIPIH